MKTPSLIALALISLSVAVFAQPGPGLGEPPTAPTDVSHLPKGVLRRGPTGGFAVNIASREQVRSFYLAVYGGSDGVPMNSSAVTASCFAGTNSSDHADAVLRRINWFRALAGLPAEVTLDTTFNVKNQAAALMMSANNLLSHTPPPSWKCYSSAGAEAANNSNLALGYAGAEAITGFLRDHGTNNAAVGHRRWLLYPQTQLMGTGDLPAQGTNLAANATWVIDGNYGGPRPPTRQPFVGWPPAGFVPAPVVFPRWSCSLPGADFTNATITMRSNGLLLAVSKEPVRTLIGENTVVWVPTGLDASSSATVFPFSGSDTIYTVGLSNVLLGATVTNWSYTVTVFDPAKPSGDYVAPVISGPTNPVVGLANAYTFPGLSHASGYEWRATPGSAFNLFDGAESATGNFVATLSAGYPLRVTSPKDAGSYSYHFAHPAPPTSQFFSLTNLLYCGSSTELRFRSRLGVATADQVARVEASTNGGASWLVLYSQPGADQPGETGFADRVVSLAPVAGRPALLRLNYFFAGGSYYPQTDPGVGWYVDNLVITNAESLGVAVTNLTATTNFVFNPTQPLGYNLDVRPLIYDFPLDWGPVRQVTAITSNVPVIVLASPTVTGSQVRLDFTLQAGPPAAFQLWRAEVVAGPWARDAGAVLTTNVAGVSYRFTTATGLAQRFYRVKSP